MNKTIAIYSKEMQEKNNEKPCHVEWNLERLRNTQGQSCLLFQLEKNFFKKIKVNNTIDILKTLKGEFQISAQKNGRTLTNLKNVHKFSTNNKKQQTLTINIPVY